MSILLPLAVLTALLFPVLIARLALRRALDMEAVVIRERITGRVTNLIIGPRWYWRIPGVDETQTLDLHFRRTTLQDLSIQTAEGLTANVTITVGWQQTPKYLSKIDPREVRPFLENTEEIVKNWMLLTVRIALSRRRLGALMATLMSPQRFEDRLKADLQERVKVLGVEVLNLNLICLPSQAVAARRLDAEARAQELRTIAGARAAELQMLAAAEAQRIRLLSDALNTGRPNDRVVDVLAVGALQNGNKHLVASMGLGTGNGRNGRPTAIQFVMPPYDDQLAENGGDGQDLGGY